MAEKVTFIGARIVIFNDQRVKKTKLPDSDQVAGLRVSRELS